MTNLTIGGGNGIATLSLNGGTINSANAVTVTSTGILTGDGVIAGDVINSGVVTADNLTVTGTLSNKHRVNGSGRINASFKTPTERGCEYSMATPCKSPGQHLTILGW
jgi:DNA/RNA endonuclease YhcR with UshA esterase domain